MAFLLERRCDFLASCTSRRKKSDQRIINGNSMKEVITMKLTLVADLGYVLHDVGVWIVSTFFIKNIESEVLKALYAKSHDKRLLCAGFDSVMSVAY